MHKFKKIILKTLGCIFLFLKKLIDRSICIYQLSLIKNRKEGCNINGPGYFSYEHIQLGKEVHIGTGCTLMASESRIIIGDNAIIGRHTHIIGGNHRFDIVGKTIKSIHEKRPQDDADIIIDEECWLGANCIILKGVHIGRGCVVGAGSIVTKDIPPYTIYTNRGMRPRFTPEQIKLHEELLNNHSK